jgi:hypothetical protein
MRSHIPLLALAHIAALCRVVTASIEAWEAAGFDCEEKERSVVCSSALKLCTGSGSCAHTEVTESYDEQGSLVSFRTCNRWNPDPTGERRDGCMTGTYNKFEMVSCVAEFEDASGALVACNSCAPCDDGTQLSMDCTNVVPAKQPCTCELLDLMDGGEVPFNSQESDPGTVPPGAAPGSSPVAPEPASSGTAGAATPSSSSTSDATAREVSAFVGLAVVALSFLAEAAEWFAWCPNVVVA